MDSRKRFAGRRLVRDAEADIHGEALALDASYVDYHVCVAWTPHYRIGLDWPRKDLEKVGGGREVPERRDTESHQISVGPVLADVSDTIGMNREVEAVNIRNLRNQRWLPVLEERGSNRQGSHNRSAVGDGINLQEFPCEAEPILKKKACLVDHRLSSWSAGYFNLLCRVSACSEVQEWEGVLT